MIPLTKENREGLQLMVELCTIPSGPRDPRVTGAMAWAENLPRGPILSLEIGGNTLRCDACPFRAGPRVCIAKRIFGLEQCPLEGGGVLITGKP